MPLTKKGAEIKRAMVSEYGPKKGEQVFYASKNAGTIHGVDEAEKVKEAWEQGRVSGLDSLPSTITIDEIRKLSGHDYHE